MTDIPAASYIPLSDTLAVDDLNELPPIVLLKGSYTSLLACDSLWEVGPLWVFMRNSEKVDLSDHPVSVDAGGNELLLRCHLARRIVTACCIAKQYIHAIMTLYNRACASQLAVQFHGLVKQNALPEAWRVSLGQANAECLLVAVSCSESHVQHLLKHHSPHQLCRVPLPPSEDNEPHVPEQKSVFKPVKQQIKVSLAEYWKTHMRGGEVVEVNRASGSATAPTFLGPDPKPSAIEMLPGMPNMLFLVERKLCNLFSGKQASHLQLIGQKSTVERISLVSIDEQMDVFAGLSDDVHDACLVSKQRKVQWEWHKKGPDRLYSADLASHPPLIRFPPKEVCGGNSLIVGFATC